MFLLQRCGERESAGLVEASEDSELATINTWSKGQGEEKSKGVEGTRRKKQSLLLYIGFDRSILLPHSPVTFNILSTAPLPSSSSCPYLQIPQYHRCLPADTKGPQILALVADSSSCETVPPWISWTNIDWQTLPDATPLLGTSYQLSWCKDVLTKRLLKFCQKLSFVRTWVLGFCQD